MNTTREENLWLTVRLGNCQRYTETDGKLSRRHIKLCCPTLSCSFKGEDQPGPGDEIELWFHDEADAGEAIGSFDRMGFIDLSLPPTTFAEFWTASVAADGAARDISIRFKKTDRSIYTITKVQLIEHVPEPIDFNPKAHGPGYIPGRVHPVVAELRDMRSRLITSWRGVGAALVSALVFVALIELISSALRALWRLISG
jgi:hypothetical protein